jgi:hypothetical protein
VAVIALNTVVLFLVLNLVLHAVMVMRATEENPADKYGNALMRLAYPEWNQEELRVLMTESYQPLVFEPYTHFKDRPVLGKYVNVDLQGFRRGRHQGPWPIRPENVNIFFFGGSTAFGYGLPDDQTIPSYLQEILSARMPGRGIFVYNFGRGYYVSTQERIALEQLVTSGTVPDLAVFLDGLNDFLLPSGNPEGADRLAALMEGRGPAKDGYLDTWPAVRAARWLLERVVIRAGSRPAGKPRVVATSSPDADLARQVIRRWLANKEILEAIGGRFGFGLLFVWQPVAAYGFDAAYHPFFDEGSASKYSLLKIGYGLLQDEVGLRKHRDVLWLADAQRDRRETLYVDQVHYNAKFSKEIAAQIAERIWADQTLLSTGLSPRGSAK